LHSARISKMIRLSFQLTGATRRRIASNIAKLPEVKF